MEWIRFFFIMFVMHWPITVSTAIAAFYLGHSDRSGKADVWFLLTLGTAEFLLMPYMPGAATREDAMVYLGLPVFVPVFVLGPYLLGMLVRFFSIGSGFQLQSPIKFNPNNKE